MPFPLKLLPVTLVALVLGGMSLYYGSASVWEGYASTHWPQTTGTIQQSSIGRQPIITYTYIVDGHPYQNSRIDTRWAWNDETTRQIAAAYPLGSQRTVYYSPSTPSDSLLINGLHRRSFFGLILGTLILTFGALLGGTGYLAPIYGFSPNGRTYTFANNSPIVPIVVVGAILIAAQFALLFWMCR
jgi:hypothetical protein